MEEFPESTQARVSLASAYFELEDYESALQQYRAVVETAPNDILVLEKIAQIFEILGQGKAGAETALRVAEVHFSKGDVDKGGARRAVLTGAEGGNRTCPVLERSIKTGSKSAVRQGFEF
jgi:hypothetical protein